MKTSLAKNPRARRRPDGVLTVLGWIRQDNHNATTRTLTRHDDSSATPPLAAAVVRANKRASLYLSTAQALSVASTAPTITFKGGMAFARAFPLRFFETIANLKAFQI